MARPTVVSHDFCDLSIGLLVPSVNIHTPKPFLFLSSASGKGFPAAGWDKVVYAQRGGEVGTVNTDSLPEA